MNIKEFFDYMTSKKKEKETVDYHKVENALRDLMWQEKCKKCTAIFFDSYLGDIYTIMPEFDRLFTINFNYDDNLGCFSVSSFLFGNYQIPKWKKNSFFLCTLCFDTLDRARSVGEIE